MKKALMNDKEIDTFNLVRTAISLDGYELGIFFSNETGRKLGVHLDKDTAYMLLTSLYKDLELRRLISSECFSESMN